MATSITAITGGTPSVRAPAGARQFQAVVDVIAAQVALTDATLPAQTSSQVSVTIPGAAVGDFVLVSYPATTAGGTLSGQVTAADTVLITLFNTESTDAVTALSGGLSANVLILKPKFSQY